VSLGYWQIGVALVVGVVSPFLAAYLAVGRISRELDNARLDDLRGVLDEVVEHLARADRLTSEVKAALSPETSLTVDEPIAKLDGEVQALIALYGRVTLRLFDDPLGDHLHQVVDALQNIRNAAEWVNPEHRRATGREIGEQVERFRKAHAALLKDGRALVGPSAGALRRARRPGRGSVRGSVLSKSENT
jgi:hypothetical protein